jgi:predicted RNase H-like nuclease (RuvC/YqgF family)
MNSGELMIVLIVLIVMGARVLRSRHQAGMDWRGQSMADDPEAARLRDEVRNLKERIQVLERVITDNSSSSSNLEREIEKLRDRSQS